MTALLSTRRRTLRPTSVEAQAEGTTEDPAVVLDLGVELLLPGLTRHTLLRRLALVLASVRARRTCG